MIVGTLYIEEEISIVASLVVEFAWLFPFPTPGIVPKTYSHLSESLYPLRFVQLLKLILNHSFQVS